MHWLRHAFLADEQLLFANPLFKLYLQFIFLSQNGVKIVGRARIVFFIHMRKRKHLYDGSARALEEAQLPLIF